MGTVNYSTQIILKMFFQTNLQTYIISNKYVRFNVDINIPDDTCIMRRHIILNYFAISFPWNG